MRFGHFELGEQVDVDGISELFEATTRGPHGAPMRCRVRRLLSFVEHDDELTGRFLAVAHTWRSLRHPGIAEVYEVGRVGPTAYFAMERLEGRPLRAVLDAAAGRGERVPVSAAYDLTARILDALTYAERTRPGSPCGDITPELVWILPGGAPRLASFGLEAHLFLGLRHEAVRAAPRDLRYLSPEVVMGKAADARSDLFLVALLLVELLRGAPFVRGDTPVERIMELIEAEARLDQIDEVHQRAPEALDLLRRALARDPDKRPASAEVMRAELLALPNAPQGDAPSPFFTDGTPAAGA